MTPHRRGLRCRPFVLGACAALFAPLVAAQDEAARLGTVTVTATRTEALAEEVAATITTVEREDLERGQPADEAALFADQPDVVMARDARRFGATRPNIRGIEDNRVVQLVDGVRLADFYDGGGPTNFTMSAPLGTSTDFLKRVEILRGPASSLYGSDAIGGVVGYLTLDPADLVADGARFGGRYRAGYTGENDGFTQSLLGAWRGETVEALVGYTRTAAHEFDNRGDDGGVFAARSEPNPQDVTDRGVLAKLVLHPSAAHRLALTVDARRQDAEVEVARLSASLPRITAMDGEDSGRRVRTSLEWQHRPADTFYDRLTARLYHQYADTTNANLQTRSDTTASCSASRSGANDCRVEQLFEFAQRDVGASLQFDSAFGGSGGAGHLLSYGLDLSRSEVEERRDAWITNLTTGSSSKSLAGDDFPVRDFPKGRADTIGAFVQDEVAGLAGGRLTLVPGLRYDWRRLAPEVDALARQVLEANDREAVEQSDGAFSPRLAALWRLDPAWTAYAQLVTGFRAPNYAEVNGSFRNSIQRYGISPNPDLDPETSVGGELGVKLARETLSAQLAVYDNRYRDFIERVRLDCPADPRCIDGLAVTLTSENISRVRIYGAEARFAWQAAPGWQLDGAFAWARGLEREHDEPLDSVEPARLVLGVARDAGRWGAAARVRAAAPVTHTDDRDGEWFQPGGYAVADLSAWWRPAPAARLGLAVHNLFDKKYWLWSDIRQADDRDPQGVDFYSQPGRSFSVSFSYDF